MTEIITDMEMRLKTLVSATVLALTLSAPVSALGSVVKRTALLVSNIEEAIEFYEAIGFSIWLDRGGDRDRDSKGGLPLNGKPAHGQASQLLQVCFDLSRPQTA